MGLFNFPQPKHPFEKAKELDEMIKLVQDNHFMEGVEVIEIPPRDVMIEEGWANGTLLWRRANGIDITPDGDLIKQCTCIIHKSVLTQEEIKKFYGH